MPYYIQNAHGKIVAKAKPGRELGHETFMSFAHAVHAYGFLCGRNETLSGLEWQARIRSTYQGPRVDRVCAAIDQAMPA